MSVCEDKLEKQEKKARNIYYLSARKVDGKLEGWEVKRENCDRITAVCKTKEEALAKVKTLAAKSGATVIVRKADGTIQDTIKFNTEK